MAKVVATILGIAVLAGAIAIALMLPTTHCTYSGDVGMCSDRSAIKILIGVGGVFVAALIPTVARHVDE